jgi:hypothetical protein
LHFKTEFKLKNDDEGVIIGAGLSGDGSTEGRIYCSTFVQALVRGKANIRFQGNSVVFEHSECEYPGTFSFERSPEEIAALKKILIPNGKLKVEASAAWTGSFSLFLKQ